MGCDLQFFHHLNDGLRFQSTHPRGVRLYAIYNTLNFILFQSTHPRGVRLKFAVLYIPKTTISIHAPTWGATISATQIGAEPIISIHAPTWGATSKNVLRTYRTKNFNPRTHVGCDLSVCGVGVSPTDFNPRTHVGCDRCMRPSSDG